MPKTTSYIPLLQGKFLMTVTTECTIPDHYQGAEIEICVRHKAAFTDSANCLATEISDLLRKSLCPVQTQLFKEGKEYA
jgi:hypothetical protein